LTSLRAANLTIQLERLRSGGWDSLAERRGLGGPRFARFERELRSEIQTPEIVRVRYFRDLRERPHRYLTVEPSTRAHARLREKLRRLTRASAKRSLVDTVAAVNTLLRGWHAYFRYGYPRRIFRMLNHYVHGRFRCFLRNRSQRRSRPFRQGESLYAGLQRYGLRFL
jgi:hypothetical protein